MSRPTKIYDREVLLKQGKKILSRIHARAKIKNEPKTRLPKLEKPNIDIEDQSKINSKLYGVLLICIGVTTLAGFFYLKSHRNNE